MENGLILKQIRPTVTFLGLFIILFGFIYPAIITLMLHVFFPHQAQGSLINLNEKLIGSELIGQSFQSPHYFWGRLSATSNFPYNSVASSGSNFSPANPMLLSQAQYRIQALALDPSEQIPIDLVSASASGLDPHISVASATLQIKRIAKNRNLNQSALQKLINETTENRQFGFLGEKRVNVLKLNIKLDEMQP